MCLGKLVKHFSEQLAVKYGLGPNTADFEYFPSLSQWLQVFGYYYLKESSWLWDREVTIYFDA